MIYTLAKVGNLDFTILTGQRKSDGYKYVASSSNKFCLIKSRDSEGFATRIYYNEGLGRYVEFPEIKCNNKVEDPRDDESYKDINR